MEKDKSKDEKLNETLDKYIQAFKLWNKVSNNKLDPVWMDKEGNKIFNPNLIHKLNNIDTNTVSIKNKIKQINKNSPIKTISEFLENNPDCIQHLANKTCNKLILKNKNLAITFAELGQWTTENTNLLKLKDKWENTIAHLQTLKNWTTSDIVILKLQTKDGTTVAHSQAQNGWTIENPEILKLQDKYGNTVAHYQAEEGWTTENPEILKLKDEFGNSVAHYQAWQEWTTENLEILKLPNKIGYSIAHAQATKGWTTENPEILKLKNKKGYTVQDYINKYKKENP